MRATAVGTRATQPFDSFVHFEILVEEPWPRRVPVRISGLHVRSAEGERNQLALANS